MIGADTETHLIMPYCLAPKPVVLTLYSDKAQDHGEALPRWLFNMAINYPSHCVVEVEGTQWFAALTGPALYAGALQLLNHHTTTWHNMPFDLGVLAEHVPGCLHAAFKALREDRAKCTAVREKLLSIATGTFQTKAKATGYFTLAGSVLRRMGVTITDKYGPDTWRTRYAELDGQPFTSWPPRAKKYAMLDAKYHFDLWGSQAAQDPYDLQTGVKYIEDGHIVDEGRQFRAAWALHLMACEGVRLDEKQVAKTLISWDKLSAEGIQAARDAGFRRSDGSIDKKVLQAHVAAAYDQLEGIDCPMTDGGKKGIPAVSTAGATLLESGNATLKLWGKATQYTGYLSKAGKLLTYNLGAKTTGPNVLVATGRTSWKGSRQGPPKKGGYRECHVPPPGYLMSSIDYNQVELLALAWVLESWDMGSGMANAIRAGRDLHYDMAAQLAAEDNVPLPDGHTKWTYELAVACGKGEYGAYLVTTIKAMRGMAKVVNFGLPGGLGAKSLRKYALDSYDMELTLAQCLTLIKVYKRRWPSMVAYFKHISELAGHFGGSFTVIQPQSMRVRAGCTYTSGCNTHFQGPAADGIKVAMWRCAEEMYLDKASPLYGSRAWLMIHDEILFNHPEPVASAAARRASVIMVGAMAEVLPGIPVKAPPALMRRWRKEAEPVFVDGVLVPWEDRPQEAP